MKLLALTWACDGDDISEPRTTHRWVSELAKDHELTIFSVSKPDRYGCVRRQFPHHPVIEWRDIRLPRAANRFQAVVKPGYLPYYVTARRHLRRLLDSTPFDVIHHLSPFGWRYPSPAAGLGVPLVRGPVAGGLRSPSGFAAELAGRDGFAPFRAIDTLRLQCDPVLRSSYRQTEQLLISAPYVENFVGRLTTRLMVEPPHGIDDSWLAPPRPLNRGDLTLLYVGRVIRWKGLRDAIRALALTRNVHRMRLLVAGDGPDLAACRQEAGALDIADRVYFLGSLPHDRLKALYASADIFIFPSFREPVGAVVLEAMASSLPSIVATTGGPGFLIDDSCGKRIEPRWPQQFATELAQAMDELCEDRSLLSALAHGAYARASTHFRWEEKRRRIATIYQQIQERIPERTALTSATIEPARTPVAGTVNETT